MIRCDPYGISGLQGFLRILNTDIVYENSNGLEVPSRRGGQESRGRLQGAETQANGGGAISSPTTPQTEPD